MTDNYFDIYKRRLNRYGSNPGERLEKERQRNFENFLYSSPHYLTFSMDEEVYECVFEPKSQNNTKTEMSVLCRVDTIFDIGSVAQIDDDMYMFYYWSQRKNSGYNKFIVLKLSHRFTWEHQGVIHEGIGYLYSKQAGMTGEDPTGIETLYTENNNKTTLVIPYTAELEIGTYFKINVEDTVKSFIVEGYDEVSTPGITYVTLDPTYRRDETPVTLHAEQETDSEYFWMTGKMEVGEEW